VGIGEQKLLVGKILMGKCPPKIYNFGFGLMPMPTSLLLM
jgi:hypothetical protein